MNKERLKDFILSLQKVYKQPKRTFDLGLIVKEPKSKITSENVFNEIKKIVPIEKIIYDERTLDEEVMEQIVNIFEKEKWVFLEIKKDIGSPILNQLKHLANYNSFQILDFRGQEVFEMKMPENSRVIVFSERNFIENKINYPHFYTLFGPVWGI